MAAEEATDDFISELLADSGLRSKECLFCVWLRERPDAQKWVRALDNEAISTAAIIRKAAKEGFAYKKPLMTHRLDKHSV